MTKFVTRPIPPNSKHPLRSAERPTADRQQGDEAAHEQRRPKVAGEEVWAHLGRLHERHQGNRKHLPLGVKPRVRPFAVAPGVVQLRRSFSFDSRRRISR